MAEAFGDVDDSVEILREHQMPLVDVERMLSEHRKGKIIGTVGKYCAYVTFERELLDRVKFI